MSVCSSPSAAAFSTAIASFAALLLHTTAHTATGTDSIRHTLSQLLLLLMLMLLLLHILLQAQPQAADRPGPSAAQHRQAG